MGRNSSWYHASIAVLSEVESFVFLSLELAKDGTCVEEAWKQQQLARYWNRQALEAEAAAKKALPAKVGPQKWT